MIRKIGLLAFAAFLSGNASAVVWFVNHETGDDTAAKADDTGNTPFRTIQAAISKATAGDTVKVGPGTYNTSLYEASDTGKSRIIINKNITLESTGGRDLTVIEGAWDTETGNEYGLGNKAIRCIYASSPAVIKGFTLRNGATQSGADSALTSGGGLLQKANLSENTVLLDCLVENCSSTRGGGMRRGMASRTIFRNCYASNYGAAAREARLMFCFFDDCKGKYVTAYTRALLNCTFYNNNISAGRCVHTDQKDFIIGNCVFVSGNAMCEMTSTSKANCKVDGSIFYGNVDVSCAQKESTVEISDTTKQNVLGGGVFSPLFGDMHPVKGGVLDGTGNVGLKSELHSQYRDYDIEGNPVLWTEGKLCPGAFQKVIAPASGKALFCNNTARLTVDGVEVGAANATSYTYSACWPTQYLVNARTSLAGNKIARLDMYLNGSTSTEGSYRPPLNINDEAWVTAPPSGTDCAWSAYETKNVCYVDDDAEYEGEADGTEAKPYRTIAEAATNTGVRVICVKEGVYSSGTGSTEAYGLNNRVQLDNGGYVRMIGVAGAEKTFIVGEADPDTKDDPERLGCGPKAVRCVSSSVNGVIQGFTLTGGHSDYGKTDGDTSFEVYGGMGVVVSQAEPSKAVFFVDCIISNNVAYRASMCYGGTFLRCYFANNRTIRNEGGLKSSVAANCIFTDNNSPGGDVRDYRTYVYNCTFNESNPVDGVPFADCYVYNSICQGAHSPPQEAKNLTGTVIHGFSIAAGQAALKADPCFRDADNGDLRVATVSPAVGFGDPFVGDWWKLAGCDFYGNRYRFVGGKVISGAIQELVPSVRLGVSAGPESGISESGVVFLDGQNSVTVTAEDAGTRLYEGFSINGEIVPGSKDSASFTYALGGTMPVPGDTVNAVYLTNWYVNATSSNANRGDTPDTAKKTLAEAVKYAVEGDVVHVAEGVYDDGEMLQGSMNTAASNSEEPYIRSRVVVPTGVRLVADGRREHTVIMGEDDPDADDGCGRQAVRCVFANTRTLVKGFTLRGGKTDSVNLQDDNNWGGGVLAARSGTYAYVPVVEDCAIEDCRSMRGGGSMYGVFRNCRFTGNTAKQGSNSEGASARAGYYYGCYFDNSVCASVIAYPVKVDCCTFGPGNLTSDGKYSLAIGSAQSNDASTITDTLFCGGLFPNDSSRKIVNCAYRSNLTLPAGIVAEDCVVAPEDELAQLDKNGVPLPGKNPACDRGVLSQWTDAGLDAARDAAGNPRVANGAMDIGCYEADWKGVYSATVGKRGSVTFAEADSRAHKGDSAEVYLPEGVLSGTLNATGTGRYEFPVRITGGGKLVVSVGDSRTEYASSGVVALNLQAGEYPLSFAYFPCENDEGGAFVCSGGRIFGTSIVIR